MDLYEHQFAIFDKGGTVYWALNQSFHPIEELICKVFIDGRGKDNEFQYDTYSIRWVTSNEHGITFAIVFDKRYADKLSSLSMELLENVKSTVLNKYLDKLKSYKYLHNFDETYSKFFKQISEKILISNDKSVKSNNEKENGEAVKNETVNNETEPKGNAKLELLKKLKGKKPTKKRGAKKPSSSPKTSNDKKPREWDNKISKEEMERLNFSTDKYKVGNEEIEQTDVVDITFESESESESEEEESSWSTGLFKYVKNLTQVELKEEKLNPILLDIKNHLVAKNVSYKTAEEICDSVKESLIGKTHTSFKSITTTVKEAITEKLTKVLSQKKIDIAMEIYDAKEQNRPYVITFVGVNGVGKSTSLSKVCAWLLNQKFTVMIAACDSFRSGAIEQLAVHSRNLNVPLFKQDYGADPAAIAASAIKKAKLEKIDVVLVDTAGRMQDNTNHMKELGKLINVNKPDLIIFVGEALVGNESNNQLKKFNESIMQNSSQGIDGIFLTKFDTVDDKVGAAISMVHETGHPILFVGVGQNYKDIRTLNVKKVVSILTK